MNDPRPDDPGDRLEELLSEHRDDPATTEEPAVEEPFDPFAPEPDPEERGGDHLPDAPLFDLLRTLEQEITAPRIDQAWIFPPRRVEAAETAVVVISAFTELDPDRRRVYAAHYTALDDSDQHRLALAEYGTAPADRVGRLVEDVVERIKDGPGAAPRAVHVEGRPERWDEMLHELATQFLEERQKGRWIR